MKNHVNKIGIELEGYWHDKPEGFKEDGSVHFSDDCCNGRCLDDCYCHENCECNDCQNCHGCDNIEDECNCEDCLTCNNCDNQYERCSCTRESTCDKKSCIDNELCDSCTDDFLDNQDLSYNCSNGHNTYNNCQMECNCECDCECDCKQGGELSSKPLKLDEIRNFINNNYPDELNSSCGMHCHLSFKDDKRDLFTLATPEFYNFFLEKMENWANIRKLNNPSRFYHRLKGVEYAKREFKGYEQLKENCDRYTHINFNSYRKFKTVEFRLATMFDNKDIGIEYIYRLYDIVNEYLNKNKPKALEFNLKINKSTSIYLKLDMVKEYVKTKGFSNYDKFRLYENIGLEELNTNLNTLIDENSNLNYTFLRLKGQSHGKSMIIKGVFTNKDVERYMRKLIYNLPNFIIDIKGEKIICAL